MIVKNIKISNNIALKGKLMVMKYFIFVFTLIPVCVYSNDNYFDLGKEQHKQGNYSKAKQYYEKACELNIKEACNGLGLLYFDGDGVKQDRTQAVSYFKKACELEYGEACGILGLLYLDGDGVKQDRTQAVNYFKKACELGYGETCDILGLLYLDGDGVK